MQEVNVSVAVRVRPILAKEKDEPISIKTISSINQIILGKDRTYTFDHVFPSSAQQSEIYEKCVSSLVKSCLDGYNATVLAYGQTGSGKTYTMGTSSGYDLNDEEVGLIPRIVHNIFTSIKRNKENRFIIRVSYLEVYKDELRDLLDFNLENDPEKTIFIRDDENSNTMIVGAVEKECSSVDEVLNLLMRGSEQRHIGKTKMNEHSSRSHAIFTLFMEQEKLLSTSITDSLNIEPEFDGDVPRNLVQTTCGKIHCVDLAGSERANRTGNTGERFKESICINTGLLALGNVISALGNPKNKATHIPYRASKITRLLKDSLGGNSRTLVICCVSPAFCDMDESLNALNFANRARNIKNKPVINLESNATKLSEMKIEIKVLREELYRERTKIGVLSINSQSQVITDPKNDKYITELENNLQSLQTECQDYQTVVEEAVQLLKHLKLNLQLPQPQVVAISEWMLHVKQLNENNTKIGENKIQSEILDKDQEIKKLKTILAKYEKDLDNDQEIFSDRTKESLNLRERIDSLENEKVHMLELLEESEVTIRCLREKVFQLQDQKEFKSLQASSTNHLILQSRQRATSVPSHKIGDRIQLSNTPARTLHTSPASFSSDRILKQVRLRGQMLYSMAEDVDDVMSTYREDEDTDDASSSTGDQLDMGDQPSFHRGDKSRGTYRKDDPTNAQSLQTLPHNYDQQSEIKLPRRRISQLNMKNKNDIELSIKIKDQMIDKLLMNQSYEDQLLKLKADKLSSELELRSQQSQVSNRILAQSSPISNSKRSLIPMKQTMLNKNIASDEQKWIEDKLELLVEQRRVAEALQKDLENREKLVAEREAKMEELNCMKFKNLRVSKAINQDITKLSVNLDDINRVLSEGGDAADVGVLKKHRDDLHEEYQRLMDMVDDGQILEENDQRRLIECEEAVDALSAAIDFNEELILTKSRTIKRTKSNNQDEIVSRIGRLNAQESKQIISTFLDKIVNLRNEKTKLDESMTKLQVQLDENEVTITHLESLVATTEEKMESRITHLQQQLNQPNNLVNEQEKDHLSNLNIKIKQLEKELFYYKSNCQELKKKLKELLNSTPTPRPDIVPDDLRISLKINESKESNLIPRPPGQANSESVRISTIKRSARITNQPEDLVVNQSNNRNSIKSHIDFDTARVLVNTPQNSKIDDKSIRINSTFVSNSHHENEQYHHSNNLRASNLKPETSKVFEKKIDKNISETMVRDSLMTSSSNTRDTISQRTLSAQSLYDSLKND